jgi:haloalkane dehalogenase
VVFNTFAFPFTDAPRSARVARLAGTSLFRWGYRNLNLSFVISKSAWGAGPRPAAMWKQYTQVFPDADSRERVLWALAKSLAGSTAFFQSLWDRRARLAGVPVHFIWGLADSAFPPDVLARLRTGFPHASAMELPRAGHWPHEEKPERCLEEVRRFLGA